MIFGVGVPLAAQSIVRACPSLIVLVGGGGVVNWGGTKKKNRTAKDTMKQEAFITTDCKKSLTCNVIYSQ